MRKLLAGSAVAVALVAGGVATAHAADHSTPGTPGAKNCRGQTEAYVAQAAKNGLIDEAFRGIGGVAHGTELSVQDWQQAIIAFCAQ